MDAAQLYALASQVLGEMGISDVTPSMAACIALNESGGDPNAERAEPQINDASYGLMQTLLGTATWLHDQMGFTAYDATAANLLTPAPSMYFGCAYLHWLRNWHGPQPDAFVVAAYNGGPGGASGAGPQRYLASWQNYMARNGWSA